MQWIEQRVPKWLWRTFVATLGGTVLVAGLVMVPYPGPGWLTVFAGLAILATEFPWARRLLRYGKRLFLRWERWVKRQRAWLKLVLFLFTSAVVIVTIWLFNGYGLINGWLHLHLDWLRSPFLH